MPFDNVPDEPSRFQRILRHARQLLARPGGWIKEGYREERIAADYTSDGYAYCFVGALNEARNIVEGRARFRDDDQYSLEINDLAKVLGFKDDDYCSAAERIPDWNDNEKRTKRAVLRRIDRALAKLDAGVKV